MLQPQWTLSNTIQFIPQYPIPGNPSYWRLAYYHLRHQFSFRINILTGFIFCRIQENNTFDRRPIQDRHVISETHQRPTCMIRARHAWRRPTCLIGDRNAWWETQMPDGRPIGDTTCLIGDWHAWSKTHWHAWSSRSVSDGSPIRHVGLQWVSYQAFGSPVRHVGLRSGMSVSDQACRFLIRHVGL